MQHHARHVRVRTELPGCHRRCVRNSDREHVPRWTRMCCGHDVREWYNVRERLVRMRAELPRAQHGRVRCGHREPLCGGTHMPHGHDVSFRPTLQHDLERVRVFARVHEPCDRRMWNCDRESVPERSDVSGWLDVPERSNVQRGCMLHSELSSVVGVWRDDAQRLRWHVSRHNVPKRQRVQHNERHVRMRALLSADGDVR